MALLRQFQEGNNGAVVRVYNLFNSELRGSLLKKSNDPELSNEIAEEAFIRVYIKRQFYENITHLKRSLFVIARNLFIDHIRSLKSFRALESEIGYISSQTWTPENINLLREALLNQIMAEIEKLPPQRKQILKLYFFEKMETAEVAEKMGLSTQTCLNHKTRAIQDLRYKFLQDI